MSWITNNLKQTIVYWGNPMPDGYGGYAFSAPVEIKGRWEDTQKQIIDAHGKEIISSALVFVDTDVDIDGYLFLGSLISIGSVGVGNPLVVTGATNIKKFDKIPTIKFNEFVRKAWL